MSSLPVSHRARVRPDWLDYNGHMNEAFYLVVFGEATDGFMAGLGWDAAYRERTGHTIYTAQTHITYLREADLGQDLTVTTQILDLDAKRVHLFHAMALADTDTLLATDEIMTLSVDLGTRKVAPWPEDLQARLDAVFTRHRPLPRPPQAGRPIAIRRT
ncbi:thioesterase family protein [Marinivivus vitaminiproducens]|uniref:thioesterase family protein n=1 Tax=Marinivivus vitaminiproducens TaxID=3035935 RepID=UPI0027A16F0E|nr:thioesterase family protein [Geminicoccaceae bacterium SCSIO 64248]